ncbi:hypothetical protein [Beggiatoa leptomitoformis]|uniref:Sulfur relay protein DsrC n=1 Tax=Beggiatoa leptomitoformis TaxID=288004 RepID=A0A2N9YBS4_9GAMM|nr:hypothetical protein [Beggiatoa leptomitoformis]ALG66727.1 sulfur relay protein DsrC [Beggiatoa leptomitoformis]AUI67940.1 sulfur relay protein DsrC [Beggiatoa leptomitoformis]
MLYLSEILLKHQALDNFDALIDVVKMEMQQTNERFFRFDVKPPFSDTPNNWETHLENIFYLKQV